MKKIVFVLLMGLFTAGTIQAQKVAIVDITKVLDSMDEYKSAQTQLDQLAEQWRQDIAKEYDRIKSMYNKYQAEQVLLSEEAKKQREDDIVNAETVVRDLQKTKFGPEGELFKRRQQLVQPLQDRVYNSIEGYAKDMGYDLILDKSSSAGIIFSKEEMDKTTDIIKKLGN